MGLNLITFKSYDKNEKHAKMKKSLKRQGFFTKSKKKTEMEMEIFTFCVTNFELILRFRAV